MYPDLHGPQVLGRRVQTSLFLLAQSLTEAPEQSTSLTALEMLETTCNRPVVEVKVGIMVNGGDEG